jgi:capsular exopolysaccharide synthesis family protein
MDSLPKRKLLLVGSGEEEDESPQSPLLISADPRSPLAEAYRHLRTSILLSTAGRAPRSLLITSSLPSEGKTTTATNTAISLAQTGAKVLIIDADMRRPRLHSIFNVANENGLSSLLASELSDLEVTNAIIQDERTKLFILTSGPVPPNPAELIGSQQMASLLTMLQDRFTHVVIDSLMRLNMRTDDYDGQREMGNMLGRVARMSKAHIHLVAHPRKTANSREPMDMYDIRGAQDIIAQADLVLTLERKFDAGPTNVLTVWKQRGDCNWIGKIELWYCTQSRQLRMDQFARANRYLPIDAYESVVPFVERA